MKTDSPLFDSIRVKPDKDRRPRVDLPGCEWPRCEAGATHRAPKGRQRENEHWRFCLQCGHELINEKCKLRCPRCHYFMSCSDFDFAT